MKITEETITPDTAKQWLSQNMLNRPLAKKHVNRLAHQMRDGKWEVNGEAIKFNGDTLIDGQHRLSACVQAGVSFRTVVIRDLAGNVATTIDTGRNRSGSDILSLAGEQNTTLLSASLTLVKRYFTSQMLNTSFSMTNTEMLEFLNEHRAIHESLKIVMLHKKDIKGLISPSIMIGLHYIFAMKNKKSADDFVFKLFKGIGLEQDGAVTLLREKLLQNAINKAKLPRNQIIALTIKAWNAHSKGKPLKTLRYNDSGPAKETFPTIL